MKADGKEAEEGWETCIFFFVFLYMCGFPVEKSIRPGVMSHFPESPGANCCFLHPQSPTLDLTGRFRIFLLINSFYLDTNVNWIAIIQFSIIYWKPCFILSSLNELKNKKQKRHDRFEYAVIWVRSNLKFYQMILLKGRRH